MLQRIQSVYLLLAALSSGVLSLFLPFFHRGEMALPLFHYPIFTAAFVFSALISLYSIFRYKNRRQQVVSGRLNIIINFVLIGLLVWHWQDQFALDPQALGLGVYVPVLTIIFLALANRAIMRDEMLVRSMDRLR